MTNRRRVIDMMGITGFFLLVGGLSLWSIPLAITVAGALLLLLAIAGWLAT